MDPKPSAMQVPPLEPSLDLTNPTAALTFFLPCRARAEVAPLQPLLSLAPLPLCLLNCFPALLNCVPLSVLPQHSPQRPPR